MKQKDGGNPSRRLSLTRYSSPCYFMFFLITSAGSLAMLVISFCEGPSIMDRQRACVPEAHQNAPLSC